MDSPPSDRFRWIQIACSPHHTIKPWCNMRTSHNMYYAKLSRPWDRAILSITKCHGCHANTEWITIMYLSVMSNRLSCTYNKDMVSGSGGSNGWYLYPEWETISSNIYYYNNTDSYPESETISNEQWLQYHILDMSPACGCAAASLLRSCKRSRHDHSTRCLRSCAAADPPGACCGLPRWKRICLYFAFKWP